MEPIRRPAFASGSPLIMPLLCVAGTLANVAVSYTVQTFLGLPLFLDTIFTITVTLCGGLWWGVLTGAATNLLGQTVIWFAGWIHYLYALCSIATAVITALFIRRFPAELDAAGGLPFRKSSRFRAALDRVIILVILSFTLCLVISVMGGAIAAFIIHVNSGESTGPELVFKYALFRKNVSVLLTEILSRIPLNIIDRLISVFAAYGFAVLLRRHR